jgi:hypothetical protein
MPEITTEDVAKVWAGRPVEEFQQAAKEAAFEVTYKAAIEKGQSEEEAGRFAEEVAAVVGNA